VGDAAGFLDPFTGEGIFRALRGAEILASAANQALAADGGTVHLVHAYARVRCAACRSKERLTLLIQLFVHGPALMDYVIDRLRRRPLLAAQLGSVLGDLAPADEVVRPTF